jgi:hypothetical protein
MDAVVGLSREADPNPRRPDRTLTLAAGCANRTPRSDRARQRGKSDQLDSERIARETLALVVAQREQLVVLVGHISW